MRIEKKIRQFETGFTIMELLIATAVFGAVLLIVTTAVMEFSRFYYKGITNNSVQQTTRSIADQIAQNIQFGGGYIGPANSTTGSSGGNSFTSQAYCVGGQLYSYLLGTELTDTNPPSAANPPVTTTNQANHALVVSSSGGCTSATQALDLSLSSLSGATELLSPSMRLTAFDVTLVPGSTNLYTVHVAVAQGDDDLLCNIGNVNVANDPNDCLSQTTSVNLQRATNPPSADLDLECKGFDGSQFCAVSSINVTVVKRVQ